MILACRHCRSGICGRTSTSRDESWSSTSVREVFTSKVMVVASVKSIEAAFCKRVCVAGEAECYF